MKTMKKMQSSLNRLMTAVMGWMMIASFKVQAKLPTPVAPSTGAPKGNWLNLIKGYAKDAGLVIGLVLAVVAFLWIAWITIAKFNEARRGQAEWGEVGLTAIVAAGVMVFISYLLTEDVTKDAGLVIGLVLAIVAFLWIAWITIAKFNEARRGQVEWVEVGTTAFIAAGVMFFISYLLNEASTIIV